ncbi:hypothetical protein C3V36_05355 [Lachnospiraceae bacterium oral taxon 500]|nr:hypothetical protein C3V36_05355 [Lachnospiraceae bacterium oral taxon 500]
MKKILAFTLALAMVLSTMTVTFAASKEVEALANLKLLLNTTDAEVNAELNRAVGLAMVLKALGYTQEDANAKAADNKFTDMEKAAWAKGFATLGEELKLTNGVSVEPKLFAPAAKLSKQAFVTFMLRALGYDSNEAWAKAGELAKEAKLVEDATLEDASFTKGEAAVVMYNALMAKVQGDEKGRTLAEKLVADGKMNKELAVANGLVSGEPEKLEVAEVKADNLREAVVTFNGTVDKATAEKVGNYKATGKTFGKAKLMEDNKTVVLTLSGNNAFENNKTIKLTVTGVKNVAGVVMAKQEINFTPKDVEYPTVKSVVYTGPKSLEITFSEPMKSAGKVVLKAGNSTLSATAKVSKGDEKVVEVTMFSTLKDGTEYLVCVGDPKNNDQYAKDYANYPNIYFEGTYAYTADKTAPEAKIVSADQKVVAVEFNKPVTGLTVKHFYHSFAAYTAKKLYKDAELKEALTDKNEAVSKVWVQFYDEKLAKNDRGNALPAGNVQFTIMNEADKVKIQDNWKNNFASTTFDLTIVADREAPEVVSVEVDGEKDIKVTFNEKISNIKRERFTLLDKDGKEIEKGSKMKVSAEDGDKVAKLSLSESYAGKTVTLQIKGIKDASLYENMMADYTTTFEFGDKTWKGLKTVEFKREGSAPENYRFFVYATFGEDMDSSAVNVDNYKFQKGGKTVKVKGSADFFEGKANIVVFELSYDKDKNDGSTDASFVADNGLTAYVDNSVSLLVNNAVKDLAGNTNPNFQQAHPIINWSKTEGAPKIEKVEAVETRKVVVKFDKNLQEISTGSFKIWKNYGATDAVDMTKDASYNWDNAKTLEIYLADDKALPTGQLTPSYKLVYTKTTGTYDVYGRYLEIVAGDVVNENGTITPAPVPKDLADKMAPAVASFKYISGNANTSATSAAFALDGKTGNDNLDGKPIIKVTSNLEDPSPADADGVVIGAVVEGKKEVKVRQTVTVLYTEEVKDASLSITTYTFNNDFSVTVRPTAAASDRKVNITIKKVYKVDANKPEADIKAEILDWLNDLTVTQVNSVEDMANNVMSGNSNALDILDVK